MWHTLATLELALGCLYPVIITCQHHFPPDAEVREAAFYSLQSYYIDLRVPVKSDFVRKVVTIYLGENITAKVHLAGDYLLVYMKESGGFQIPFWIAEINARSYLVKPTPTTINSFLPGDWWQTVIKTLDSEATLNTEE